MHLLTADFVASREFSEGFEQTYGIPWELGWPVINPALYPLNDPEYELYYQWIDGYLVLYYFTVDCFFEDKGYHTWLWYDDVFDYVPLIHKIRLEGPSRWIRNPVACGIDTSTIELQTWLRSIKIRPSYVMGKKYQQVRVVVEEYSIDDLLSSSHDLFQHKRIRYPDCFPEDSCRVMYYLYKSRASYKISGYDGKDWLFTTLCFVKPGSSLFGAFIDMTDDEQLRKKHRCYLLGHTEPVRFAYAKNYPLAEFGFNYGYKEPLQFQLLERPNLDLEGTLTSYADWET